MKRYLERLEEIIQKYGNRTAFCDSFRSITYAELDEESAKIYAYLKKNGIGKEDFVQIVMPRSVSICSAVIGVLKAGAAFVLLEDTYPDERILFIKENVGTKLVLDAQLFNKIMDEEKPHPGYEKTDLHDAAYAIYTSGSTGNPKGIIHEYGNIDQEALTVEERDDFEEFREGLVAPFYFMAAWHFMIKYTLMAYTVYIIPQDMVRDFNALKGFLIEKRINGIFLSPSYIRLYKNPSPYLTEIETAGEPANGIFYPNGPRIRNIYGMSECGFTLLEKVLDQAYDEAPVGKPLLDVDLHIIDEEGNRIEGPGKGEICFKNEFVRGYIDLPEKTAEAFIGGYYYTNDIAKRDDNGNYYIVGRKDDMIKINGNRIEPAEIESKVKSVTGLEKVVAKGFKDQYRAFICVYYLVDEAVKSGLFKDGRLIIDTKRLSSILPDYMIPACYVPLDSFPLNANGKIDKKSLAAPGVSDFQRQYTAPENESEKIICSLFEKVLDVPHIGINDDFYEMGGDSIRAIKLISECADQGIVLSVADLYRDRTPGNLAKALSNPDLLTKEQIERINDDALKNMHDLFNIQYVYIGAYERYQKGTVYNNPELYVLKGNVDIDRLAIAVDKVFKAHPVLLTRFTRCGGTEIKQVYDEELFRNIEIIDTSEEDFKKRLSEIVQPMKVIDGRLYRNAIYRTESSAYLFIDIHHILVDGTSIRLIKDQIYKCYTNPDYRIPKDYYYYYLWKNDQVKTSEQYKEAEEYYRLNFPSDYMVKRNILKPDFCGPDECCGMDYKKDAFNKKDAEGNLIYLTAAALAASHINDLDESLLYAVYNGRNETYKNQSAGMFACYIPIYLKKEQGDSPKELIEKVNNCMQFGMAHCEYPYPDLWHNSMVNTLVFNYQKDTMEVGCLQELISEQIRPSKGEKQPADSLIMGLIDIAGKDELTYFLSYSKGFYSENTVERIFEAFEETVNYLKA